MSGRAQRVDGPARHLVVLTLYLHDGTSGRKQVLVFDASKSRAWLAEERPSGDPADGFVKRLRNLLVGAHVQVESLGKRHRLRFEGKTDAVLLAEKSEPVLRSMEGKPLAGRHRLATQALEGEWEAVDLAGLEAHKEAPGTAPSEHRELDRILRREEKRLKRKLAKIEADGQRAEEAATLRQRAIELLATSESDVPKEQADKWFHRAKRLERGAAIAAQRAQETRERLGKIAALRQRAQEGTKRETVVAEALALGVRLQGQAVPTKKRVVRRKPYREFQGAGGRQVLVGRSSADNDELTLRHARPHDLWLHCRGRRGAHVVVPLEKGEACPPDLLGDAALLAAHFSDAAGEDRVEVQHCLRRHVHKRKGAPVGAVVVSREKVLLLRLNEGRLRELLASELK